MIKHRSLPSTRPRSVMSFNSTEYECKSIPLSTTREILSEIASGQLSSSLPNTNPTYSLSTLMTNDDDLSSIPAMQIDCKIQNSSDDKNVFFSKQCFFLKNEPLCSKYCPKYISPDHKGLTRENYLKFKQSQIDRPTDMMCVSMPDSNFLDNCKNIAIQQTPNQQSVLISNRTSRGGSFVLRSAFSEQNLLQDMEFHISNLNGRESNQNLVCLEQRKKCVLSDSEMDGDLIKKKYLDRSTFTGSLQSRNGVTPSCSTFEINSNHFDDNQKSSSTIILPAKNTTVRRRLPEIPKQRKPRPATIHSFDIPFMSNVASSKHDESVKLTDTDLDGSLNGSRRSLLKPLDIVKNVIENELNVPTLKDSPSIYDNAIFWNTNKDKSTTKRSQSLPSKRYSKIRNLGVPDSLTNSNISLGTSISVASDVLGPSKLDCEDDWSLNSNRHVFRHEEQNEKVESIGCIISEVRNALLAQSKIREKYSDSDASDKERKYNKTTLRGKKQEIEGKSHYKESVKQKNVEDVDDVFASFISKPKKECKEEHQVTKLFTKCKSRSSSGGDSDTSKPKAKLKGDLNDEVFDAPFTRNRLASFHGNSTRKRRTKELRRTSSLEGLKDFQTKKNKEKTRHSSVSINEHPSVYEYIKSPVSPIKNCRKVASSTSKIANINSHNLSSSSKNGIALLSTSPKRTSLKKTNTTTMTHTVAKNATIKKPKRKKSSGEYDERIRDKSRFGEDEHHQKGSVRRRTERDRQRDLERKREQEQLDGALSSDQERGSSHQSTIDRSFSNNEGTPEDKIGKCIEYL